MIGESVTHLGPISMDKVEVVEIAIKAGGALGGGFAAMKVIRRMFVSLKIKREESAKRMAAMQEVIDGRPHILAALEDIRKEIKPNGGSSLRDSIDRIEQMQAMQILTSDAQMTAVGVAYWKSDKNGRCTYASRALCQALGATESDILGGNWLSSIHPDDREDVAKEWHNAVKHGRTFDLSYRISKPDGTEVKVHGSATPLTNPKTKMVEGMWGSLDRITKKEVSGSAKHGLRS